MGKVLVKERVNYIKKHVTVKSMFERYGWRLPANANDDHPFQVSCPFKVNHSHGDRNKSMRIYPPDGFYCFTCGRGGDVFDLVSYALEDKTGVKPSLLKLITYFEGICGRPDLDNLIEDKIEDSKGPRVPKELDSAYSELSMKLKDRIPDFEDTTYNSVHYSDCLTEVWSCVPLDLEGWSLSDLIGAFEGATTVASLLFSKERQPLVKEPELEREDKVYVISEEDLKVERSLGIEYADEDIVF